MKVVVFGATGQLGRELARIAWPEGYNIRFLDRAAADFAEPAIVSEHIRSAKPDVVINAAAYTAVDLAESHEREAYAANANAPAQIALACSEIGAGLIHISTDYVFDGTKTSPYVENDPIAPLGVYGQSKAAGEALIRNECPRHFILRTAWVYSPFGKNFVKTMMNLAVTKKEVRVVDDQIGSPTSAGDLASAIAHLVPHLQDGQAVWGTYHVTGDGEATWFEFAEAIFEDLGRRGFERPNCIPIPTREYPTPAKRPANSRLNNDKFAGRFGKRLPHWRSSLARVLDELHSGPPREGSLLP
jgi:dTDP-4-dehydrorhamnose reductase